MGASTSWIPQGLSTPVMVLLFLIPFVYDGVQVLFVISVVSSASYGLYVITLCRIKAGALVLGFTRAGVEDIMTCVIRQ